MKELIKQALDCGISRRDFLSKVGALGISTVAANAMAQSLTPFSAWVGKGDTEGPPSSMREMEGNGGELLVAQLKAAGVEYIFFSPSVAQVPIYNALVDEPGMHLIQSLHEAALIAMANGYAKVSGKTPFVLMTRAGLVNAVSQIYNSSKDQTPTIVGVDWGAMGRMGVDGFEDMDDLDEIVHPMTKWHWIAETVENIPDVTRRAWKFASTKPSGPVFVGYPKENLRARAKAVIIDQAKFDVPMNIRPDAGVIEETARALLQARSPLLYVGDEIVTCGAEKIVVELAELLGLPVARGWRLLAWSMPFPTRHPLYLGDFHRDMRYPSDVDLVLNLGGRMPYRDPVGLPNPESGPELIPGSQLIQIRLDTENLARVYPTDISIVANVNLAIEDLLSAIRSVAPETALRKIRTSRMDNISEYTAKIRAHRQSIARSRWDDAPISIARMGVEMEEVLDPDTIYVAEPPSGSYMDPFLSFGGTDKQYISHVGGVLGWGVSAAFGAKLAQPDRPVVCVVGDGAFQFMGPQPLWSFARYEAPVTIIVINNHGMDGQRSGVMATGGKQLEMGLNMGFFLGDPDMDFAKMAESFGVEGETVTEPAAFRPALERAKRATAEGRPYLLDVHTERSGLGAASSWHPAYSVASRRKRKV